MKCDVCGLDDKNAKDWSHVCAFEIKTDDGLEEFDRHEELMAKEILDDRPLVNLTDRELYEAILLRGSKQIYDEFLFQNTSLQGRGEVQLRQWARDLRDFFYHEFVRKNENVKDKI